MMSELAKLQGPSLGQRCLLGKDASWEVLAWSDTLSVLACDCHSSVSLLVST